MSAIDRIDKTVLGERLRTARATAGLTQEETAQKLGFARTTLVAIEAGQRALKPAELAELARIYGTSMNSLLRAEAIHPDLTAQFRKVEPSKGWAGPKWKPSESSIDSRPATWNWSSAWATGWHASFPAPT